MKLLGRLLEPKTIYGIASHLKHQLSNMLPTPSFQISFSSFSYLNFILFLIESYLKEKDVG